MRQVEADQIGDGDYEVPNIPTLDQVESFQFAAKATAEWMNSMTTAWNGSNLGVVAGQVTHEDIFKAMLGAWYGNTTFFYKTIDSEEGDVLPELVVAFQADD